MNLRPLLFCSILLAVPPAAMADELSADQRFLAGLRQRGLFSLAEKYCIDRLAREDLTEQQRAELTIQWSRTLAATAVNSPPLSRPAFWQRALAVTEEFAEKHPQNVRLLLVRLQGALGLLDRGELARQESQMVGDRGETIEEARKFLAAAGRRLDELAEEVEVQLQRRNLAGRDEPGELAAHQLASIQKNIRYQQARACRNQAQCYVAESPDRDHALSRAVQLLQPLAGLDPRHPLAWKSHVDLIRTRRLLGDLDAAAQLLDALVRQELPAAVMLRALAEQIRMELAAGRLPEAISAVVRARQIEGTVSAELDDACLEVYLAAWRAAVDAKDDVRAGQWQKQATAMVRRIDAEHGPYWARRAEMRLAGYVRGASGTGDLAMLVRAAESSYRSGRFDDALDAYDRARQSAEEQGDTDRAFDLGYVAAAIEHKRRRHEAALNRYLEIARAMPQHAKAADAHLLGIDHAAEMTKQRPKELLDGYMELLREHVDKWPGGTTADNVYRRLGRLHAHGRRWKDAIDAYRSVSAADPAYRESVEAASACYRAWLVELAAAGKPVAAIAKSEADDALAAYEKLAAENPGSGAIQEAYAQLLLTRSDPESRKAALAKWRELEKKSPPQSPRWFLAKYRVAWLHCEMGNKQQAKKMIALLKLLHPEMGEMKAEFDALRRRCGG